jgi:predicted site-specific integrase-resolvase
MVHINGEDCYTTFELSRKLNKSQETIRRWCREGRIETHKLHNEYFIPEREYNYIKRVLDKLGFVPKNKIKI